MGVMPLARMAGCNLHRPSVWQGEALIQQQRPLQWRLPPAPLQRRRPRCCALRTHPPSTALAAEEAWQLLLEFTKAEARGLAQPLLDSPDQRRRLRDAVLVAASQAHAAAGWDPNGAAQPEVLLGVLASDVRLAVRALRDYCQALGLPYRLPESRVAGAEVVAAIRGGVYCKYNSASGLCYATAYTGRDRGVLLQLGQQQLGHLPLGLFDEAMAAPPPALQ